MVGCSVGASPIGATAVDVVGEQDVPPPGERLYATSLSAGSPAKLAKLVGTAQTLALGPMHACVSTTEGVQCWGMNGDGELGGRLEKLDSADPVFVRAKAPDQAELP